ncbi:MAG: DNA/RNA helicase domain-containing protein [Anaerotardibacter sp.]
MTKPTNLSLLSVAGQTFERKPFCLYEGALSSRTNKFRYNEREIWSFYTLIDEIQRNPSIEYADLNGFVFSYSIPRISAEFDLLKTSKELTLNIELKSQSPGKTRIRKQLVRNQHFLRHLSCEIVCFSYIAEEKQLYILRDKELELSTIDELVSVMKRFDSFYDDDFNNLFSATDYLISPITNTEAFLQGTYYLNGLQEVARRGILQGMEQNPETYCAGITGLPGTGKTLLLFDVALEYSRKTALPVCVIHCGQLQDAHKQFNQAQEYIIIVEADRLDAFALREYSAVFIDEAQRMSQSVFDILFDAISENKLPCVVSMDLSQTLTNEQAKTNVVTLLRNRFEDIAHFKLDTKVRTNNQIWNFTRGFFDLSLAKRGFIHDKVSIVYVDSIEQALFVVEDFQKQGYQFIRHGGLGFNVDLAQRMNDPGISSADSIGLEYEKVVMTVGSRAYYDETGKLRVQNEENESLVYTRSLFQGVTRARENFALVVVDNPDLFTRIVQAFY